MVREKQTFARTVYCKWVLSFLCTFPERKEGQGDAAERETAPRTKQGLKSTLYVFVILNYFFLTNVFSNPPPKKRSCVLTYDCVTM